MTRSYQYTTRDHPDCPVVRMYGAGTDVAVITVADLDLLRSCRDFVEECAKLDRVETAARLIRAEYGPDAPVLALLVNRPPELPELPASTFVSHIP